MKDEFVASIHSKNKIRLAFYSKEDRHVLVRVCAPMDYGPSRRAHNKADRFHFWDYESDTNEHVLSLLPRQIAQITTLPEAFEPSEFVSWVPRWLVPRNWGAYS